MAARTAQRAGRGTVVSGGGSGSGAAGVAASFALLVLTAGVPAALYVFGRDLVPSTVVSPSVMWNALKQPDDGHIFLQGVYLAAWVGWFLFFLSVFVEVVAVVQHRAAVRLPGIGWLQRGAGTLVTAVVVMLGSPAAAMAATPSAVHIGSPPVATAPANLRPAVAMQQRAPSSAAAPAVDITYTVQAGDSLWKIAQQQLGDPNRFAEIALLNDGRVMADGTVFHYAEFLRTGWVLLMPTDASPSGGAISTTAATAAAASTVSRTATADGHPVYTVQPGDSLSSIAKARLGDAHRWEEIFELNKGRPQPGGPPIWRPDLIWPGDVLLLPAGAATVGGGHAPLPAPPDHTPAQHLKHRPATDDADEATPPPPAPTQHQDDVDSAAAPAADSGKTVDAVGGLLAAGVLTALGARRLSRLRRRRPGDPVELPPPDDWEREMRTVENPTGRVFIAAALQTLAVKLAEVDRILPDLAATVLKPHGLELHLSRMEPPVPPFYADASRPGVWICPLGAPLADVGDNADAPLAPYPALVSLGFDEGDDSVLVDLEATHGISLLAPPNESVSMLRALAIELATSPWTDQLDVTMVGFGAELPALFAPGCLHYTEDLHGAVRALLNWSASVEQVLDQRDLSLREARTYPDPELVRATRTHLLLCGVPLDAESAYRIRQLLSGRQRTSVAVVALVRETDHLLSPWAVTGPSFRPPVNRSGGRPGLHIRMQALRDAQYSAIIRDLSGSGIDDEWASAQHPGFDTAGPREDPPPSPLFRVQVEDLFRADSLQPTPGAGPDGGGQEPVPAPGTATRARHALLPANLPQFDLVLTPWHGAGATEQILAVPNAAPPPPSPSPAPTPQLEPGPTARTPALPAGLTTFAAAGSLAVETRTHAAEDTAPAGENRPGQWQSAYWNQRRAAKADHQNTSIDPATMTRSIDILGPIELSGTPGTGGHRAADLAEVAAYIALHPYCPTDQLAAELWPGRKGAATIRDAQISRLREWLGTDAYGEDHLHVGTDGYRLGPSVTCDWLEFSARVKAGELVSAVSLLRGRPFQDAPLRRYGWAESLRHEMTARIIDTAHYVAEACLQERNPRGAQNAAYRGLQAAPESELLYRDLLTALARLGDVAAARHHADTLIAYADREGIDLQPETTALLRDVLQAAPDA